MKLTSCRIKRKHNYTFFYHQDLVIPEAKFAKLRFLIEHKISSTLAFGTFVNSEFTATYSSTTVAALLAWRHRVPCVSALCHLTLAQVCIWNSFLLPETVKSVQHVACMRTIFVSQPLIRSMLMGIHVR